jgi:dethiobiotin synthetase
MKIFITGTGTNVGKTVVSGWLLTHLKHYHYWKPIQSGTIEGSDVDFIRTVASNIFEPTYSFLEPLSPHLAAKINNTKIDINHIIRSIPNEENLIIEGAGGVFVPLNDEFMMIDLIEIMNIPIIIVSNSGLGTINHTCLTIEALKNRNIEILGVIMNGIKNEENKKAIKHYGKVKILDEIEIFDKNNWYKSFLGKKLSKSFKNFQ